jgi:tripartite-type tricarboxylate transporter receptor subunit TctC
MQMMPGILRRVGLSFALALAVVSAAPAQDAYPSRPIHLIVTFPPGGSTDVMARVLQPRLAELLGQPIVVENKPGAGGNIGVEAVVKSAPDGYTIGLAAAGALTVNPSLMQNVPFDPLKDLTPITEIGESPFILAAANDFAPRDVKELIALAKDRPGAVSIGHGGNGTAMHLTAELFKHTAGVSMEMVPYRGSGPVTVDVMAGHIPLGITDMPSALALIRDGKLRALAVTSRTRVDQMPDTPTLAESGLPGFEAVGWFGIIGPAGMPPAVVARLNAAFVTALREPAVRERIVAVGAVPRPMSPEEFKAFMISETKKWSELIKTAGLKAAN